MFVLFLTAFNAALASVIIPKEDCHCCQEDKSALSPSLKKRRTCRSCVTSDFALANMEAQQIVRLLATGSEIHYDLAESISGICLKPPDPKLFMNFGPARVIKWDFGKEMVKENRDGTFSFLDYDPNTMANESELCAVIASKLLENRMEFISRKEVAPLYLNESQDMETFLKIGSKQDNAQAKGLSSIVKLHEDEINDPDDYKSAMLQAELVSKGLYGVTIKEKVSYWVLKPEFTSQVGYYHLAYTRFSCCTASNDYRCEVVTATCQIHRSISNGGYEYGNSTMNYVPLNFGLSTSSIKNLITDVFPTFVGEKRAMFMSGFQGWQDAGCGKPLLEALSAGANKIKSSFILLNEAIQLSLIAKFGDPTKIPRDVLEAVGKLGLSEAIQFIWAKKGNGGNKEETKKGRGRSRSPKKEKVQKKTEKKPEKPTKNRNESPGTVSRSKGGSGYSGSRKKTKNASPSKNRVYSRDDEIVIVRNLGLKKFNVKAAYNVVKQDLGNGKYDLRLAANYYQKGKLHSPNVGKVRNAVSL